MGRITRSQHRGSLKDDVYKTDFSCGAPLTVTGGHYKISMAYPFHIDLAGSEIKSLLLHTNQRNSLMRYLGRSFARNEEGNLIPLKQGIYGDSQFYTANGHYGILNTCNKWTAKGLESAGLTINPSLKLTAGSVMKAIVDHRMCLNKYCYPG